MTYFARLLGAILVSMFLLTAATGARSNDSEISKESFFEEGLAPVRKPASYDLTIVYFMDYQCPACRKYTPDLARVLREDPRLRVIYRDTPLLGPRSDKAALAAIASSFQGRHEAFHHALMTTKGPIDDYAMKAAARKAGVNWPRLERDMVSRRQDIELLIARNFELATAIGIAGTPAFIIGERQSNGALDYQALRLEIADARKQLGVGRAASDAEAMNGLEETASEAGQPSMPDQPVTTSDPIETPSRQLETQNVSKSNPGGGPQGGRARTWFAAMMLGAFAVAALWAAVRKIRLRRPAQR